MAKSAGNASRAMLTSAYRICCFVHVSCGMNKYWQISRMLPCGLQRRTLFQLRLLWCGANCHYLVCPERMWAQTTA
eukprot:scaffold207186_cov21-Tisochrysis_lutea.AAC.1